MKKLTNKQQAFIDYYLGKAKMNASLAAEMAGYKCPGVQGHELLKKLSQYVRAETEKRHSEAIDTQKDLLEFLTSVRRGNVTETVVTGKGDVVDNVPVTAKDRLKAAEMLARSYAMFTDKREVSGNLDINVGVGDWDGD